MHTLLEGVFPYTMKLMLRSFVFNNKYITLDFLNDRLLCFKFSRIECKDKPCPLSERMIQPEGNINQTGICNNNNQIMHYINSSSNVEFSCIFTIDNWRSNSLW